MSGAAAADHSHIPDTDEDDLPASAGRPSGARQEREDTGDQAGDDDFPFEVVDLDEEGNVIGGREGGLTEDETDEGTLLQRRQRDGQDYADERRGMSPDQRARARRTSRERQRHARDRNIAENAELRRKLDEMQQMLAGVVPRLDAHDRARVLDGIASTQNAIEAQEAIAAGAKQRWIQAMQDGDHDAAIAAQEMRETAIQEKTRLAGEKQRLEARVQNSGGDGDGGRGQPDARGPAAANDQRAPRPSPQAERKINDFFARHPWIDRRNGRNPETQEVLALDQLVASRGLRPEQDEYWDALETAMRSSPIVGHRLDDDDGAGADDDAPERSSARRASAAPSPARRGPQVGDPGQRAAAQSRGGREKFFLSADRRQALKDANVLAPNGNVIDRPKFERYLRQYRAWDAENARQ